MQSLHEILSTRSRVLLLDSASTLIQVGLLERGGLNHWGTSTEESGTGIFAAVQALLGPAGLSLDQIDAFVFCEGPGSILGIRTGAVAIRTWSMLKARPVFAYCSLQLVASYQLHQGAAKPFSVIADARRESWHRLTVDSDGCLGALERVKPDALSGQLLLPEHFRTWASVPTGARTVPYAVSLMIEALATAPLFNETPEPDAFLHEEPTYQTWTPRVHRAPSS